MVYLEDSCSKQCTLSTHGELIISALTKRAVSDAALCSYINYTCESCASSNVDSVYPLHMAASCGKTNICRWLICQKQARIDKKDRESSYTALHRSIFYGKIGTAISLIKLGANYNIFDQDYLTPLDHAVEDNSVPLSVKGEIIYIWGSNKNYTLGPLQGKQSPEVLEMFHKAQPHSKVQSVCLGKFHTVILTREGTVFVYGIGQGGRLGLGSEKNYLEPHQLQFKDKIVKACVARDHSLFLTLSGEVYSCGSNLHHVVQPVPKEQLFPKLVKFHTTEPILGISCSLHHSVAWGYREIYTWGCHAGQLGHPKSNEEFIINPRIVSLFKQQIEKDKNMYERQIISVATSQGATAIAVSRSDVGDVYILHEYQCRKIISKFEFARIATIELIGGNLDLSKVEVTNSELKLIVLNTHGELFIWLETDPQLNRCVLSLNRKIIIHQVALNNKGLLLLSNKREVFMGFIKPRKKKICGDKSGFNNFLDRSECSMIQIEKVPKLYGSDHIACDLDGENFASINVPHTTVDPDYMFLINLDIELPMFRCDIKTLFEIEDLMDVTFKVSNKTFKAHKIIIANASDTFLRLVTADEAIIDFIHPDIFMQIIKFIYTGTCDLITPGTCPPNLLKIAEEQLRNPLYLLRQAARKLEIVALSKYLNAFTLIGDEIVIKQHKHLQFLSSIDMEFFSYLSDVDICCKNGFIFKAHRCILSARSEFFRMFSMRWIDKTERSKITFQFPQATVEHLLTFIYTDEIKILKDDIEALLTLLILADHVLLERLKSICEVYLIPLLSLKNVVKILELASTFNAKVLKMNCFRCLCSNLAYVLETRLLENAESKILEELTNYYRDFNEKMNTREITPFASAASDEVINSIAELHPVSMDFEDEVVQSNSAKKLRRKRLRFHKNDKKEVDFCLDSKFEFEEINLVNEVDLSVPERLRAINSAREKILEVEEENSYVSLNKLTDLFKEKDFPDLSGSDVCVSPPDMKLGMERFDKHKMQRLSQKQRKRLSSSESETIKEPVIESPKNPWKIVEVTSPVGSPEAKFNMDNIITHEKKLKEIYNKIKSKLLIYTQMEDKALEELNKFYNSDSIFDEIISAERVSDGVMVAAPSWFKR